MKYLFSFLLIISGLDTTAQEFITIAGKIKGSDSNTPLSYCIVQLKHQSLGITANESGEFELHIPQANQNDTLLIGYIGYETYSRSIQEIVSQSIKQFQLKEKPYTLSEVVIGPPITATEVMNNVYASFKRNYSSSTFSLDGFFRSYYTSDGQYDRLIESAITVKSEGFNFRKNQWNPHSAYLKEVRSSYNSTSINDTVGETNNVNDFLIEHEKNLLVFLNKNQENFTIVGL